MSELAEAIKQHMLQAAVVRESEGIQSILAHSQETLDKGQMKDNHTVFTQGVQDSRLNNGRETTIPLFWNGKVEDTETSILNAVASGRKWPSATPDAAGIEETQFIDDYAHVMIEQQTPAGE